MEAKRKNKKVTAVNVATGLRGQKLKALTQKGFTQFQQYSSAKGVDRELLDRITRKLCMDDYLIENYEITTYGSTNTYLNVNQRKFNQATSNNWQYSIRMRAGAAASVTSPTKAANRYNNLRQILKRKLIEVRDSIVQETGDYSLTSLLNNNTLGTVADFLPQNKQEFFGIDGVGIRKAAVSTFAPRFIACIKEYIGKHPTLKRIAPRMSVDSIIPQSKAHGNQGKQGGGGGEPRIIRAPPPVSKSFGNNNGQMFKRLSYSGSKRTAPPSTQSKPSKRPKSGLTNNNFFSGSNASAQNNRPAPRPIKKTLNKFAYKH
mmetsp:Transcript_13505/g.14928  ORF Transcript_13505/g.14928 Transcript_13505/m.14928 type:complete len:317 (-) Transcript_13505:65-1015(-)